MQRGQSHPAFGSRQFSYPLSFRGQVCKAQGPLPCCPSAGLSSRRPPFLDWVPASPVPQRLQYYEGATTPTRRITGHLFVSLPGPTHSLLASWSLLPALPGGWRSRQGQDHCSAGDPKLPTHLHVDASGTSQVPRRPILCLCPVPRPRPDRRSLANSGRIRCCPCRWESKGSSVMIISRLRAALAHAVYASRAVLPPPHARLASGWLASLCREGVEPSGS